MTQSLAHVALIVRSGIIRPAGPPDIGAQAWH